jgi:hypothetical protein
LSTLVWVTVLCDEDPTCSSEPEDTPCLILIRRMSSLPSVAWISPVTACFDVSQTLQQTKVKKKITWSVTLIKNNSVSLGLSAKINKYLDSQIFGFSVLLVLTVLNLVNNFFPPDTGRHPHICIPSTKVWTVASVLCLGWERPLHDEVTETWDVVHLKLLWSWHRGASFSGVVSRMTKSLPTCWAGLLVF